MDDPDRLSRLQSELDDAEQRLKEHMASWEYAYAMGSTRGAGGEHPRLRSARELTDELQRRCRDLRAQISEYRL